MQNVIYKTDYTTKDRRTITGSFPVTLSGKINCPNLELLKYEQELKKHILSEKIDTVQTSAQNYLISLSASDVISDTGVIIKEAITLKSFPQRQVLPNNTTVLESSDLMYF